MLLIGCMLCQSAGAQTTERISVKGSAGSEATGGDSAIGSLRVISADGHFVVFDSAAKFLATDNSGFSDVFVRRRSPFGTELISTAAGQSYPANGPSAGASITRDGRFVAFHSQATNLVPSDTNGVQDVFVRDRLTGRTERVSFHNAWGQANGISHSASISDGGSSVAFASAATNLEIPDTNGAQDIFLSKRRTFIEIVSIGANGDSSSPSIDPSGGLVAFTSAATNLVAADTNNESDIFVRHLGYETTERISVRTGGAQANGASDVASISTDGRFVAFQSLANNLVAGDTNAKQDIFLRDTLKGTTERISITDTGAQANGDSFSPSISADGRSVAFTSDASNLVAGDTNVSRDIFVRDRLIGVTERISVDSFGAEASSQSSNASINAVGRLVAFQSDDTNLVASDNNGFLDVFLRDRGVLRDLRNDLLIDFGGKGLWQRLNNRTWQKINGVSPIAIAVGDLDGSLKGEAIASFAGSGLWARYDNSGPWVNLSTSSYSRIIAGDLGGYGSDDLVAVNPEGLWAHLSNATNLWRLHPTTPEDVVVGDLDGNGKDDVIADFGNLGLFAYFNRASWVKLHGHSPLHIATGDLDGNGKDELIADLGSLGLYARFNNASWVKLHSWGLEGLATGDLDGGGKDDLLVDFGTRGLWVRYNNAAPWVKLHDASPTHLITADLDNNGKNEVVADLGGLGLWVRYNNATPWRRLHTWPVQAMVAGSFD